MVFPGAGYVSVMKEGIHVQNNTTFELALIPMLVYRCGSTCSQVIGNRTSLDCP